MVKEIQMTFDEAVEYIRNNVHVRDILEVSYNRIFAFLVKYWESPKRMRKPVKVLELLCN